MKLFLIIMGVVVVPLVLLGFGLSYAEHEWPYGYWYNKSRREGTEVIISFEMFKNLYSMNPSKWDLTNTYVRYLRNPNEWYPTQILFETYKDLKQYQEWHNNKSLCEQKAAKNEVQAMYLKCWQQDITDYREKHHQELLAEVESLYKDCLVTGSNKATLNVLEQTIKAIKEMDNI